MDKKSRMKQTNKGTKRMSVPTQNLYCDEIVTESITEELLRKDNVMLGMMRSARSGVSGDMYFLGRVSGIGICQIKYKGQGNPIADTRKKTEEITDAEKALFMKRYDGESPRDITDKDLD